MKNPNTQSRSLKLTSVIRWTSRRFRASSLSLSILSFSARRAAFSISCCLTNAFSNCKTETRTLQSRLLSRQAEQCKRTFSEVLWFSWLTNVIRFSALHFSSWASMVFSKSSCLRISSSTWWIESPSFSSCSIGSRDCTQFSSCSASRLNIYKIIDLVTPSLRNDRRQFATCQTYLSIKVLFVQNASIVPRFVQQVVPLLQNSDLLLYVVPQKVTLYFLSFSHCETLRRTTARKEASLTCRIRSFPVA